MDALDRTRLAPRLVLVFAVLACLVGWGNSVAAAAGERDHTTHHGAHAGSTATFDAPPGATQQRDDEHGGHAGGHDHALTCMATSAAAAFSALAVPGGAELVISAVPAVSRVRAMGLPAPEQRGPSIAALCVQRT